MSSSAPPPQTRLEPGTRLDRYELLCVLAHGGMANVWLARVQGKLGVNNFNKLFAVKTILPNVVEDPAFKDMFLDEARIASRIEHPNVVHMTDVGEFAGVPYLVMDLVDGEPLSKLPRACTKAGVKMPLGVALRILADACHGLHAAHELRDEEGKLLGVVHRDMSPQNILVSTAGVSKVIDFGVAKARDRATAQTSAGTLKGKINYMPREQALGRDVDRRTDTWALGAVLYSLLSGKPPYKEENQLATLQLAMNAAPITPLADTFPLALRTLVMRALAHEPAQRFQTAAEMGNAIEELMRKLQIGTTHAQVGAFVHKVFGEKIEARQQLVASAIAEASNRARAREALTAPLDSESRDERSSVKEVFIAVPTAGASSPESGDAVRPEQSSVPDAGTAGTFVATTITHPRRPRWPLFAMGAAVLLALLGIVLVVVSLRRARTAVATAAAETAAPPVAPSTAPVGDPPAATPPATPPATESAPPATEAAPPATARADSGKPVASTSAPLPRAAAKGGWSPPPVKPSVPASTKPPVPGKRHDDEAGF